MTCQERATTAACRLWGYLLGLFAGALFSCISGASAAASGPFGQDALADAQSLESRGAYQEAAQKYQAALEQSPSSPEARLGVGRMLAKLGRCEESKDALKPLAGSPRADVEQILGACYFRMHSFDLAITHLKLARDLQPKYQEVWIDLGRAYASAGRNTEAISTLKSWLAQNPHDPDALYWIGSIYNSMSQNVLDGMIAKDPGHYLVLELEGDQFRLKQDYAKALQAYQAALKAAPDAPGLHFNVGDVYYQTMKLPEASEQLEKELKINPYHPRANFELGDIDIKQGRVEEGMAYLNRALKLDPALTEAHRSLARGLLTQKRYEDAVRELLWVTKADPSDHTAHAMLASAYRQTGRMKEAQQEAEISQKLIHDQEISLENLKREEQEMNDRPPSPTVNHYH
ncbi:MAG TPA: tetratricopeptide repeat protein [Terriglobia bacterium]|nr:tetratricopeptide repeat protein [Terriglobia bacterium]